MEQDFVLEKRVEIKFKGEYPVYDMKCYDGYSEGTRNEFEDERFPYRIKMTYPKLSELTDEEKLECLLYRGIEDKSIECNYGDVMMLHGKVIF